MSFDHQQLGAAAARLARRLPYSVMLGVADAVALHGNLERAAARRAVLHGVPTPDFRDATAEFLDVWHSSAVNVGSEAAALAVITATTCEHDHRHEETTAAARGTIFHNSRRRRVRFRRRACLGV
jgi:hypothetical protein